MQRDILLLTEMIDVAEQAQQLTADVTVSQLEADRNRRDALLWNFTVLGEAAGQLSAEVIDRFPELAWRQPVRLRNRIVHGYRAATRIRSRSARCLERPHRWRLVLQG